MVSAKKNLVVIAALAALVNIVADSQASTMAFIESQLFYTNENCQGTPDFQDFEYLNENFCYTNVVESGPGNRLDVVDIATGQIVAQNADSLSFSCQRPTTSTGQHCEKQFHKTVGSFCLRYYANNQFMNAQRISCYPCRPVNTISKPHCNKLIQQCENLEIIDESEVIPVPAQMKWTGRGCRIDGKPVGDGGCQCDGYCGYTCERACNADSQCYWDTNTNQCFSAETNTPGEPIKYCFPENTQSETAPAKQPNGKLPWFIKKP